MLQWLLGIGLLVCVWAAPAEAACSGGGSNCFVRSTGGNSGTNTTYSLTTGGASCACLPATTDIVVLDSNSGQFTINAALSIGAIDASGLVGGASGSPYTGTLTHGGATLTINTAATNSLLFTGSMTYTATLISSLVTFANTSGTAVLTSGGKNFAAITMNGVGGTVQQADDLSVTAVAASALTITNGIFDANGHATTVGIFASNNANTRSFLAGSAIKIGGNIITGTAIWNVSGTLTFTKGSANIEVVVPTSAVQSWSFTGGGLAYNGLTLDTNIGTAAGAAFNLTANNSFSTITVGAGWLLFLPGGGTETLSGALTVNGTVAHPSGLQSLSASSLATVSAVGTCTATYTSIYGITGTGGCTFTGTNSYNLGSNSGWTITAPSSSGGGGFIIGG